MGGDDRRATACSSHTDPQVFEMSIPGTVEALLSPDAPLALRLTGQLLLGVVRIYSYKVAYLHQVRSRPTAWHLVCMAVNPVMHEEYHVTRL